MNFKLKLKKNNIILLSLYLSVFLLTCLPIKFDLSKDKKNSIQVQSCKIMQEINQDLCIDIYLGGQIPVELQFFKNHITNILDEFVRSSKSSKILYKIINIKNLSDKEKRNFLLKCKAAGIGASIFSVKKKNTIMSKKIYPVAIVKYGNQEKILLLIKSDNLYSLKEILNEAINKFEYEIINTILNLKNKNTISIALLRSNRTALNTPFQGCIHFLKSNFKYNELYLSESINSNELQKNNLIIIAEAKEKLDENQLYLIDQYIMNNGKVMFFIDSLNIDMAELYRGNNFGISLNTGLDNLLFKYGVSVDTDIILDYQCSKYPFITGRVGNQPNIEIINWPFFPIINHFIKHPITQGIHAINVQFASSIYASRSDENIKYFPIASTSQYTAKLLAPFSINIERLFFDFSKKENYKCNYTPIACILEGNFDSFFKTDLLLPTIANPDKMVKSCCNNKIFVATSSSILKNSINTINKKIIDWGWDPFLKKKFDNRDFINNTIRYMLDLENILCLHSKKIEIYLINKAFVEEYRKTIQIVSLAIPLLILMIFRLIWNFLYKKKWTKS